MTDTLADTTKFEDAVLARLSETRPQWRTGVLSEDDVRDAVSVALSEVAARLHTQYGVQLTVDGVTSVLQRTGLLSAELEAASLPASVDAHVVERLDLQTAWRSV